MSLSLEQQEAVARSLANTIINPNTGDSMEYEDLLLDPLICQRWETSSANEFGRSMEGIGDRMSTGTQTIIPIHKHQV